MFARYAKCLSPQYGERLVIDLLRKSIEVVMTSGIDSSKDLDQVDTFRSLLRRIYCPGRFLGTGPMMTRDDVASIFTAFRTDLADRVSQKDSRSHREARLSSASSSNIVHKAVHNARHASRCRGQKVHRNDDRLQSSGSMGFHREKAVLTSNVDREMIAPRRREVTTLKASARSSRSSMYFYPCITTSDYLLYSTNTLPLCLDLNEPPP